MRKLLSLALALTLSSALVTASYATQDRSFTNISSAGMFEDVYDLFKLSPAYVSGFQKATLWTQLSNLYNTGDQLLHPSATQSSYLVLGGQMDFMGMGRAGLMLDWDSDITPISFTLPNHAGSVSGYGENTSVDYLDTNNDQIFDTRGERIAAIEKMDNILNNDIYAVYGLGGFMGMDVGASVRARWLSYSPTWNDWNSNVSLKETYEEHTYDMLSGSEISKDVYERSGELNYGYSRYDLTVGARHQGLIPDLDLVANLGGIFNPYGNDYEYLYERTVDADLATPNTRVYEKVSEKGIEPGNGYYPGIGLGGLAEVRGDYKLTKNINVICDLGFEIISRGITDSKQERETIDSSTSMSGLDLYSNETVDNEVDTYEGSVTDMDLGLKVRGIYQGEGWRLGVGIAAATDTTSTLRTTTSTDSNVVTLAGRPDPANNSTVTTTSGDKQEYNSRYNVDILSFPVGLQIDILKNFPIYFGAEHRITVTESTASNEVKERTPTTATTVDGNGVSTTTIDDTVVTNVEDAYTTSTVTSNHATYFYYGLTWWPKDNIQIDLKNVYRLDYWADYELSFTFHF